MKMLPIFALMMGMSWFPVPAEAGLGSLLRKSVQLATKGSGKVARETVETSVKRVTAEAVPVAASQAAKRSVLLSSVPTLVE